MQIPILSGIFADEAPDFRTALPRNLIPVPKDNGISAGYLRPADGVSLIGTGPGMDRGGINWNDICYRVMGSKLVRVNANGTLDILGDVGNGGQVSLDYSLDRLGIASNGGLYYWTGTTLQQVTDTDLGTVLDMIWFDGYFVTTDGAFIIVTDLSNPLSVNPLKYGTAEADPDPIKGLLKLRREIYALNRYTIESFSNVGGANFPFSRNEGAMLQRGAIGTHCACVFLEQIAFLGSGRKEPPAVWLGANGETGKISTREIDTILQGYSEAQLALSVLEARTEKSHEFLYLHLPDRCLVYDAAASQAVGEPVWFTLDSGVGSPAAYRARNLVWCYNKWLCGDPTGNTVGTLNNAVSTHYGAVIGWEFGTRIIYNESRGAVFHELELIALSGRVPLGADPVIWTSHSIDGETWSSERPCKVGRQGDRTCRITWLRQGYMPAWRIQKFRGTSDAHLSFARLEAQLEPLNA